MSKRRKLKSEIVTPKSTEEKHHNTSDMAYLNSKNILQNQMIIDRKIDVMMDNQKVLDLKLYYVLRNIILKGDVEAIKKFDKTVESIGDVLGQFDYKEKVNREKNSQMAELDSAPPRGTIGPEKKSDGPVDTDAKRKNGSSKDTSDS